MRLTGEHPAFITRCHNKGHVCVASTSSDVSRLRGRDYELDAVREMVRYKKQKDINFTIFTIQPGININLRPRLGSADQSFRNWKEISKLSYALWKMPIRINKISSHGENWKRKNEKRPGWFWWSWGETGPGRYLPCKKKLERTGAEA